LKVIVSLLIAVGCLLAVPALAGAAEYTVDSTLDEADLLPGAGGCLTAGGKCTLRAAIEESNFAAAEDTVKFDPSFDGQLADTIVIGSSLPAIKFPLLVDGDAGGAGGQCNTAAAVKGPCVGVDGPAAGSALTVEDANGVKVEGLAVTGATGAGAAAINVINGSESFEARDNWFGVKLDGSAGANNKGIFIDPNSDSATIGGKTDAERNVFANSSFEGLDIEGADNTDVFGNYFGVKPDGVTVAANAKNIEITNTVAFLAIGTEVGTKIEGAALTSTACDGGCNVIAGGGLSTGIDLDGDGGNEAPATGPTLIRGNYVGLAANGTTVAANGTFDVLVGAAENAEIGGEAAGEANYIAGGGYGVYEENGEGLTVVGNVMGSDRTGADVTPPGLGVFLLNTDNTLPVQVYKNVIRMAGSVGIEVRFGGAEILQNFIEGAELGILTKVAPGPAGANLIEDNEIEESTTNGIRIEDEGNLVFGNSIYKSGAAGIRLQAPALLLHATKNKIGGNTPARENNIRESGGDAIEIDNTGEEEASQNEVARNRGEKNAGLFIDLIGATTNGGIQPPTFATSVQSSASGKAEAGATVRVFRKKAAEAGELESFLGEAVADGSGNWKVTYPGQIPVGTIVAATQTSAAGGTSELSTATAAADPNSGGGSGGKDDKAKHDKDQGKDKKDTGAGGKVPETTITKGPKGKIHSTTAKFKFSSNEKGAKFECKLDRKKFKACKSPKTYKKLKPGKHVFKVRAVKGKTVDPTPAKRKFKVLG
jgi:hypothetical protein